MVKSLPIILTTNTGLTERNTRTYQFIKHGILIAPLLMSSAFADENSTYTFNLPAQALSATLDSLAQSAHTKLIYSDATVKGLRASAVKGEYTAQQALDIALGKSGLNYKVVDKSLITITPKPSGTRSEPEATLKPMTVAADALLDPNDPYNPDYRRENLSTATKTNTPIMETPYSVSAVTNQVLKDKQVIRLEDALNTVAGVQASWTNGGTSDIFITRGFSNSNLYRDGFLLPDALSGGTSRLQTANLDHIEVLKGPGAVLYGRNEPGGVINLVTKRPQATPYHSIQQQFGSYDLYRTTLDSTGAITTDNKLLYRVNASYENAGSFRDFVKTDSFFIAPSLTWNISDRTQANLDVQYEHFDNRADSGIPPLGSRPAPVPINRAIGDPLNNKYRGDKTYVGANWSHAFNDNWKLTHRFGAEFFDSRSDFTFFFGQPDTAGNLVNVNADFSAGNRGFNNGINHQQNYYTTLNLAGKFDTAMLEHSTLWGFDYFVIDYQGSGACCAAYPEGANFNIFNPNYQTSVNPLAQTFTRGPNYNQEWYGLYWQDQIKFPFNVYGNVGVRYDNATSTRYDPSGEIAKSDDDHVSPRGGLLWRPMNWLSVYGNYSENFGVSNNFFNNPNQQNLPPQLAHQWEAGAKTEFFDKRLTASFAYFDLTKTNLPVPHPFIPNLQISSGKQESRGYEFEVAGEILPGWRTVAAYTHLAYAKIVVGFNGGVDDDTGNRMYNTPRNYGSLWNTYEFQNASLRGLKVGGGVVAASQSQGTNANTFQLPGYVTMNLMASYGMKVAGKQVTLQLNANNLLDKTYYLGTNTSSMIGVAAPRTFLGSVRVEF